MSYIIGLDIGTTSTKAIAFAATGEVVTEAYAGYPIYTPEPTFSEQNPEEIFQAAMRAMRDVVAACADRPLLGVSCSSAMHSLIAMDAAGEPLTACIIWADTRSKEEARQIKESAVGHEIYRKTGTPVHPMSPLCKIAWFRSHRPDLFARTHKFISIKEFVYFRLFGSYVIDYSIASATGLFDIFALDWYAPALTVAGITPDRLSRPVPPTHVERGLKPAFAVFLGIGEQVPFVVGASDGCLANLGASAIRPGNAAVTIGTSGAIRVLAGKPATDHRERIFSYILTERHFVLGGAVSNGGLAFRWFRDQFATPELQLALERDTNPYNILNEVAATIPAGAEGLIFLPYLMGERAPIWDPNARGVFFGVNVSHTRAHFLRAVLEGIIFAIHSVGQALQETTGEINVIYANGGFVRSDLWVQMLADVFNKRVLVTESFESSAVGAAMLGLHALGVLESLEEAGKLVHVTHVFEPNVAAHRAYQANFVIFDRLYHKLKEEFAMVSAVQG